MSHIYVGAICNIYVVLVRVWWEIEVKMWLFYPYQLSLQFMY